MWMIDEYEQTEKKKNTRLVNGKAIETRTDIERHELTEWYELAGTATLI